MVASVHAVTRNVLGHLEHTQARHRQTQPMALPRLQLIQRLVLCALLLLLLVVMLGTSRLIMMPATALPVGTRHSGRIRSTAEQRLGGRANVTLRSIRLRSEGRLVSGGGVDAGGGGGGGVSTIEALGSPDRPASFSYVVAVLSARGNFARRERIRQHVRRQQQQGTWVVAAAAAARPGPAQVPPALHAQ
eukprot:COSAG01_NODE_26297_length_718_cov_1.415186_1_plen_189_part_10